MESKKTGVFSPPQSTFQLSSTILGRESRRISSLDLGELTLLILLSSPLPLIFVSFPPMLSIGTFARSEGTTAKLQPVPHHPFLLPLLLLHHHQAHPERPPPPHCLRIRPPLDLRSHLLRSWTFLTSSLTKISISQTLQLSIQSFPSSASLLVSPSVLTLSQLRMKKQRLLRQVAD